MAWCGLSIQYACRNTYLILKSDPTGKTQRVLNAKLLLLRKSNIISKATYEKLYSSDGLSPRFYGLPKIHKPEIPLRPNVSFLNTPTYGGKYRKHCQKSQNKCWYHLMLFPCLQKSQLILPSKLRQKD